ncbi:MAG: NAD(P)-dependent oxidoreductase [Candidatus Micrarchaeaceae archaeon]
MMLVTGSKGFIGNRFVQMTRDLEKIISTDILPANVNDGTIYYSLDLSNSKSYGIFDRLEELETIVHCAAIKSPEECQKYPTRAFNTNIIGTLNLLELARRKDVKKFIYVSTGGIYKNSKPDDIVTEEWPIDPRGLYAVSKVAAEFTVRDFSLNYGIDAAAVRITAPYGPGMFKITSDSKIPDALNRHTLIFALKCVRQENIIMPFGGDHTINYTFVDDIVSAMQLMTKVKLGGFEAFNVTGGKNYKIADVGNVVQEICPNIKVKIGNGNLLSSKEKDPMLSRLDIIQGLFDSSKASKMLGYKPKFTLKEGMERLILDLRSQIGSPKS